MANIEAPNNLLSDSRFRVLDAYCEGPIKGFVRKSGVAGTNPLVSVLYDNVPVINPDGSSNYNTSGQGFSFAYTLGTTGQTVINGFEKVESVIPLSSNTRVALPPPGAGAVKQVVASFNTDLYPDADSIRVTVRVPSLNSVNDGKADPDKSGDTEGYTISYAVDISLNNGPYIQQNVEFIIGKCTSPYLKDSTYTLPKTTPASSYYNWRVRIRRTSPNIMSIRTQNELFVESIAVISTNSFNYPNTVLMATEITSDQFSSIPTRAAELDGLLVKVPKGYVPTKYNLDGTITQASYPAVWDGSFDQTVPGVQHLINGDFSQSPDFTGWTQFNVSTGTIETSSPPTGYTKYAKLIAGNGGVEPSFSVYQTLTPPGIVAGDQYTVKGWYKTSSTNLNFQVYINSDNPLYNLPGNTSWTYFETTLVASNSAWVIFGVTKGSPTTNSDILELAGLEVQGLPTGGKQWTNNPAWAFYDLITNKRYGLGQYIQESLVDKWTLYQIAQYCDELVDDGEGGVEPRFTCNCAIANRQDAYQLLQNFISIFQGMIYWAGGQVITSQVKDTPIIQNFTQGNVIDGKFTYSNTARNTRSTVIKVKWINPNNFYKEQVDYVEDIDGIARYGYVEKEITAFACTSRGQAIRAANWVLLTERYMTETITFQAGLEGIYIRPGDLFSVYDNFRKNSQQGGRIMGFDANRNNIVLDREIFLRSGYTYDLSATIPKYSSDISSITGSDQIEFIRNSQIENRRVTTAPNGSLTTTLALDSGFSTGLYEGSIWLLKGVGTTNILATADPYRCLATSEVRPGVIEVLGAFWNTGINYTVDTGYNVLPHPDNSGDTSPIAPPYNLAIDFVTGTYIDNNVYTYLSLNWTDTPSSNKSYYEVSGKRSSDPWELVGNPVQNFVNQNVFESGIYQYNIRAVSIGGQYSTPLTGQYIIPTNNPFGQPPHLSGVYVIDPNDKRLGSTGYFGNDVTIGWTIPTGQNGYDIPSSRYLSGYIFHALNPATDTDLITPVWLTGIENQSHRLTPDDFNSFIGGPIRQFKAYVETFDTDLTIRSGASAILNNPAPQVARSTSFYGLTGNLGYSINEKPFDSVDISGVDFWFSSSNTPNPTFATPISYESTNLGGNAPASFTGTFYTWYSLIDTFGRSGCQINGPYTIGQNSVQGPQGNVVITVYQQNFTTPTTPSSTTYPPVPGGWSLSIPSDGTSTAVWGSTATFTSSGSIVGVWSTPKRISGNVNFYQTTAPVGGVFLVGDMWWDTDDNYKLYRWNGSSWVGAFAPLLGLDALNHITGLTQVGGTNNFILVAEKFQVWNPSTSTAEVPFEIFNNGVYINTGYVRELTFGRIVGGTATAVDLVLADSGPTHGQLRSQNYVSGVAGVVLRGDGYFEASNGLFRGTIDIGSNNNKTHIDTNGILFGNTAGASAALFSSDSYSSTLEINYSATPKINIGSAHLGGGSVVGQVTVWSVDTTAFRIGGSINAGSAPILTWANDTNLYRSSANVLKTDDNFTSAASITADSFTCRAGQGGAAGNQFNLNWTASSTIDAWIDTSNVGTLLFAGSHTASTITHDGYVTMKDSAGNLRNFMVGN